MPAGIKPDASGLCTCLPYRLVTELLLQIVVVLSCWAKFCSCSLGDISKRSQLDFSCRFSLFAPGLGPSLQTERCCAGCWR